jgi:cytochrome oxidase assembly protein ShyY1
MGRRIALVVAAIVVALVCVRLGFWQLDRLEQRRALNEQIGSRSSNAPISLDGGLPDETASWSYSPVTASGEYLPEAELILYGRPLEGRPGDHVLSVLTLGDGTAVLVDRGWIPFDADTVAPVEGASAAPSGHVTVTGVLIPSEEEDGAFDDAQDRIRSIDIEQIGDRFGLDLEPGYLLLSRQSPEQPGGLPVPAALPELSEGPHLSYAIQWFSFATIAIVGSLVLLRRSSARRDDYRSAGDQDTEVPSATG